MSSNGSDLQAQRVVSIRRKLHQGMLLKKISIYLGADLLLFFLIFFIFLLGQIYAVSGVFPDLRSTHGFREWMGSLLKIGGLSDWKAQVKGGEWILSTRLLLGTRSGLVEIPLQKWFLLSGCIVGVTALMQALKLLLSYPQEDRAIRRTLSPLSDLALRADELTRLSFDEDKFETLGNALDRMRAEDTQKLNLGDRDLAGIEAAINNLLTRMRESYRQQARFVNDASHELKTPIAVIQGYANMLDRWGKEDPKILDESIHAIKNESDHMSRLVEQLLFLARGDAGRAVLKLERIDLVPLMREIYEESLMIDEGHRYLLKAEDAVYAFADAAMLKQAVRILVENAAKYTEKRGEIALSAFYLENHSPCLQVEDTGIGMEEKDVRHIFERFYRSDEVRNYQGTGLGLSIAKWIVDRHRGHFEVVSREELGSRIRIVLQACGQENEP